MYNIPPNSVIWSRYIVNVFFLCIKEIQTDTQQKHMESIFFQPHSLICSAFAATVVVVTERLRAFK